MQNNSQMYRCQFLQCHQEGPRNTCPLICLILASGAARPLPAHLPDTRQRSRATPAWSSAWYTPAEPRDTCPLICLKRANGALRPLPAHLPDTRQRSCATTARSSAWYSPAESLIITLILNLCSVSIKIKTGSSGILEIFSNRIMCVHVRALWIIKQTLCLRNDKATRRDHSCTLLCLTTKTTIKRICCERNKSKRHGALITAHQQL